MDTPDKPEPSSFSFILKQERSRRGFTQDDLGKLIGIAGRTVCRHEKGKMIPSDVMIGKYCRVFPWDHEKIIRQVERLRAQRSKRNGGVNGNGDRGDG